MSAVGRGVRNAFRNGVRLFSIVVILGLSIAHLVACGAHQYRRAVTGRSQPAAHGETVHEGHEDVQQDEVGVRVERHGQRLPASIAVSTV